MKNGLALLMAIVAIIFATWSFVTPPEGEINANVLILIAQCLVFSASMLGIDTAILSKFGEHNKK